MATGHRVKSFWEPKPPEMPKELTRLSSRTYSDRFGMEYVVIWNGQPTDPPINQLGRSST